MFSSFCVSFCLVLVLVKAVLRGVKGYLFVVSISIFLMINRGFPDSSMVKNLPAKAGAVDLISGSGKSPGGGNGSPLQYSCLENSMGKGACQVIVHHVTESDVIEQLTLIFIKLGVTSLS